MTCKLCTKPVPTHNKVFCSRECRTTYTTATSVVTCDWCGSEFKAQRWALAQGRGRYCTKKCSDKARVHRPFDLTAILALVPNAYPEKCGLGTNVQWFEFVPKWQVLQKMLEPILGHTAARMRVYRYRQDGLTASQADDLATKLGYHPAEVWGKLWWENASRA